MVGLLRGKPLTKEIQQTDQLEAWFFFLTLQLLKYLTLKKKLYHSVGGLILFGYIIMTTTTMSYAEGQKSVLENVRGQVKEQYRIERMIWEGNVCQECANVHTHTYIILAVALSWLFSREKRGDPCPQYRYVDGEGMGTKW